MFFTTKQQRFVTLALLLFFIFPSFVTAAPYFINPGFEEDLTGWFTTGTVTVEAEYPKGSTTVKPYEGSHMAVMDGTSGGSSLSQTLDGLSPGTEIAISFYYYNLGGNLDVIVNDTTYDVATGNSQDWMFWSQTVTPTEDGKLTVTLSQGGGRSCLDNFSPVPLPSAIWFLGSGLIGIGALRFKNKILR